MNVVESKFALQVVKSTSEKPKYGTTKQDRQNMKTWKAQMKTLDMHRAIIDDMIVCVLFHRAGHIDSRSHKLAFLAPYTKIIEPLSKLSGASAPEQESLDEPKPLASMLTEHLGRDFTIDQVAKLWK